MDETKSNKAILNNQDNSISPQDKDITLSITKYIKDRTGLIPKLHEVDKHM